MHLQSSIRYQTVSEFSESIERPWNTTALSHHLESIPRFLSCSSSSIFRHIVVAGLVGFHDGVLNRIDFEFHASEFAPRFARKLRAEVLI